MAKCEVCGRKGLFLKLDKNHLCPVCAEERERRIAAAKRTKTERIKVAGTSYYQNAIKKIGEKNDDYSLSKKELREDFEGERVFALSFDPDLRLVPEPENENDKNAIRVEADGVKIGYVPKSKTKRVREIIESPGFRYSSVEIEGGKYKIVDEDGNIERDEIDFWAELVFKYEEVPET